MVDVVKLLPFGPIADQLDACVLEVPHEAPLLILVDVVAAEVFFDIACVVNVVH